MRRSSYCANVWHIVCLGSVVLFALIYSHQRRFDSATPVSRLDLLHAIVCAYSLSIDRWERNTTDKTWVNQHYCSDKAPGTTVIALPAFAVIVGLGQIVGIDLDSKLGWLVTSWSACAFSQALPTALGAAALFVWLSRFVRRRAALVTVLALTLGSLPLPYSTLLFSHAQVIGLIGIAVWAMGMFQEGRSENLGARIQESEVGSGNLGAGSLESEVRISTRRMALAGFCLGLALASEYTAGIVVVALVVYVVVREWRAGRRGGSGVSDFGSGGVLGSTEAQEGEQLEARSWKPEERQGSAGASPYRKRARRSPIVPRPLLWFLLAAIPPLLLIPAYSWAMIGNPFQLPYSYQASFPQMSEGLYAIKWPDLENLGRLLIGPTRGLVFWTPFLVLAGFGWWWMAKERPRWLWLTYAVPVFHALIISGRTWDWQAGYTLSARYMAPILPLLALPCAIGTQRWPKLGGALAIVSIAMMTLATLTDACPDYSIYNPLTELHIPKLLRGEFSYTLGTEVFGLPPWLSVAVYYAILIGGIAWLWHLTGKADKAVASQPLTNLDGRG